MSATLTRPTTITITERTRRRLEAIKAKGVSFDELIEDLLEEATFDDAFFAEIERRWSSERRLSGPDVLKKAGLA